MSIESNIAKEAIRRYGTSVAYSTLNSKYSHNVEKSVKKILKKETGYDTTVRIIESSKVGKYIYHAMFEVLTITIDRKTIIL